jgi:general secretion pathway protein I
VRLSVVLSDAGLTLVELLVAAVLLATGLAGVMMALSTSISTQAVSERMVTACLLAQEKMAELESTPLETGSESGDFGEDYPDYRWSWTVEPAETDGLLRAEVVVTSGEGSLVREYRLVTYLVEEPTQEAEVQ